MRADRSLQRCVLLEKMYERMTEDERRAFISLTLNEKGHKEIMSALESQQGVLDEIKRRQNWLTDFGSDVAANFLTDGLIWLGTRIFKRL